MKRLFLTIFILSIFVVIAEAAVVLYYFVTPQSTEATSVVLLVEPGSFSKTVDQLVGAGLISKPQEFYFLGRAFGISKKVRVGEYEFKKNMSPKRIMEILVSGKSVLHPVKIPEGFNLEQIADELARLGLVNRDKFLKLAKDPKAPGTFGIESPSLEGFLFPDTYSFTKFSGEVLIIKTMVERFKNIYNTEIKFAADKMGWTMNDVVTLASVIEKETGVPQERPRISSVFHNRLKINMPLQSDPTVIYGKLENKNNITREDLKRVTPYNTYTKKGLPIGPIASPGRDSMIAVVEPEKTRFLFFVSKNQGTHEFTTNIYDHNKAVNRYQRDRRNREGKSWRDRLKANNN